MLTKNENENEDSSLIIHNSSLGEAAELIAFFLIQSHEDTKKKNKIINLSVLSVFSVDKKGLAGKVSKTKVLTKNVAFVVQTSVCVLLRAFRLLNN